MNRRGIATEIAVQRLIAVVRLGSASQLHDVVHALVDGGINIIELTMTIPDALTAIERLAGSLPRSVVLGAGTSPTRRPQLRPSMPAPASSSARSAERS